jgi:hypothetical protein
MPELSNRRQRHFSIPPSAFSVYGSAARPKTDVFFEQSIQVGLS